MAASRELFAQAPRRNGMASPADAGDSRFEELYAAYRDRVLAYAMRRTDPPDAEDATSQTFVIAWRRVTDVPRGEAALPWLYATCRNVMANQRRGRRRWASLVEKLRSVTPVHRGERSEGGIATETLRRLRPDDQELLRLVIWEELTHAEVAEILGLTPNAVAIRLHRARGRFRAAYRIVEREADVKDPSVVRTSGSAEGTVSSQDRESAT